MNPKDSSKNVVSRRHLLQLACVGLGVSAGVGSLLGSQGCKEPSGGSAPAGTGASAASGGSPSCASPVDDTSKMLRKSLQYKEAADDPSKACKLCVQWENGKFGACGGCKLIPGPIRPEGSCMSFAAPNGSPAKPG
jgi:hypothetical protein